MRAGLELEGHMVLPSQQLAGRQQVSRAQSE